MKKATNLYKFLLLLILAAFLFTAAFPAPVSAESSLARLTFENRTDKPIKIWLQGDGYYYLNVPAEKIEIFTPQKGDYSYTIFACGTYIKGTLDLNGNQKIVQPPCGSGPVSGAADGRVIDLGQIGKIVKVTFTNETSGTLMLVLTGPGTYVLTLGKGDKTDYTIQRGDYTIKMYAYGCGSVTDSTFTAFTKAKKTFECP
jgi:hypothetical protein